ncbi:hypothetical protein OGAPHI_003423 [Ogataea philodendri]|uniref:Cytochrome b5 heme-binding domain-containing protein n=1 Tax=Ogataea philodendri TaxID=1378263 RepID=A0A9P8P7G8_9ASCO|nr:uncharacterized protein OGAPHI_003423 [Ogataea philodendri]KAH3666973.1 hypothetical protein OGAPHI_003423 [Ogataea philodendri]
MAGEYSRRVYTSDEVATHVSENDLWMTINDKVYDVTSLIDRHPGGSEVLFHCAGVDATAAFYDVSHSDNAFAMLIPCFKGYIKQTGSDENRLDKKKASVKKKKYRTYEEIKVTQSQRLKESQQLAFSPRIYLLSLLAFLGLGTFIYLQRKKWSEWI